MMLGYHLILSLAEHRRRKALLESGNYCLSCRATGEVVELVPHKVWGSAAIGTWCPNCGRED